MEEEIGAEEEEARAEGEKDSVTRPLAVGLLLFQKLDKFFSRWKISSKIPMLDEELWELLLQQRVHVPRPSAERGSVLLPRREEIVKLRFVGETDGGGETPPLLLLRVLRALAVTIVMTLALAIVIALACGWVKLHE